MNTHSRLHSLLAIFLLLLSTSIAKAENVLGPFDAYVSKQNPAQIRILSGEFPFKAGKDGQAKLPVSGIQGPIAVDASGYEGSLSPKKGVKGNPVNSKGTIRVSRIPEPGTTVSAQFLIKNENFLSWLFEKTVKVSKGLIVKFNIHSIYLQMAHHGLSVPRDSSVIVTISKRYPESEGSVSYQSLTGNVKVAAVNEGVRITGLGSGRDAVVATLSVGNTTFRDTIRIGGGAAALASSPMSSLSNAELTNVDGKAKEYLVQLNQTNEHEIVKLKQIIKWGERILFVCILLILVTGFIIGLRSYLRHEKAHKRIMEEISWIQSHRVRAPLARILGLAQVFNSKDLTDPVNKEIISYISFASNELDGMITEIVKKSEIHRKDPIAKNLEALKSISLTWKKHPATENKLSS